MAKASPPTEEHRSFTVRFPQSIYEQIGTLAQADGMSATKKVTQLVRLGLGEHVNLDQAVARLLRKEVVSD